MFERIAFEYRVVAVEVIEHLRLEYEEAAVDPAFLRLRLLLEIHHLVPVERHGSEARRRTNGGHRRKPSMAAVEIEQLLNVHVGNTIAVGQHERAAIT